LQSKEIYTIRPVTPNELLELQVISERTFFETFSKDNSMENMQLYLEKNLTVDRLAEELEDPRSAFYFAELLGEIVGYLKINYSVEGLEIERIYINQRVQGSGVGQKLLDKAFELAYDHGIERIWLGVWEHNPRAIRFYEKNGFVPYGSHVFKLGNDEQCDVLMRLTI
jgi:ribosomal protein S18 acetylase RimI-like enzyme